MGGIVWKTPSDESETKVSIQGMVSEIAMESAPGIVVVEKECKVGGKIKPASATRSTKVGDGASIKEVGEFPIAYRLPIGARSGPEDGSLGSMGGLSPVATTVVEMGIPKAEEGASCSSDMTVEANRALESESS